MKKIGLICLMIVFTLQSKAQIAPDVNYVVSLDGSGDFTSIQKAIDAVRAFTEHTTTIRIKAGEYHEKLIVPTYLNKIVLVGESPESTVVVNDDYSGKIVDGEKLSTFTSYTLLVRGDQIDLKDITIKNASCGQGQAVALHVEGDEFTADNVHLLGCQDTLYTGAPGSRQYYKSCYIEGTTDFIFGSSTVFFDHCVIKSLSNSYITAASTPKEEVYGYVFKNCSLIAAQGIDRVFLGRPWRPFAKTVFVNCDMGAHIIPIGWNPWKGDKLFPTKEKTTYYAEYNSRGAGANPNERIDWSHQLSAKEAKKYTVENVLSYSKWIKNN